MGLSDTVGAVNLVLLKSPFLKVGFMPRLEIGKFDAGGDYVKLLRVRYKTSTWRSELGSPQIPINLRLG